MVDIYISGSRIDSDQIEQNNRAKKTTRFRVASLFEGESVVI